MVADIGPDIKKYALFEGENGHNISQEKQHEFLVGATQKNNTIYIIGRIAPV